MKINNVKDVKVLITLTGADFLINYSHWGAYISALYKNGIKPFLLTDSPISRFPDGITQNEIYTIKLPSILISNRILRYIFVPLSMLILGIKIGTKVHVILTPSGGPSQISAFLLSKLLGKPFIVVLRTDPTDWRRLYRKKNFITFLLNLIHETVIFATMKAADRVIAIYQHLFITAINHNIKRDKVSLIYIGVDLERFRYHYTATLKDKYTIGFVGRFTYENGSETLMQIAARLPHVNFLVVGEPPPNMNEIPSNMTFTGYVPNYEVPKFLHKMDLFVSFKLVKGIPVAVMEALACGIPVIGINLEDLKKYKCVINIEDVDIANIVENIDRVLSDIKLRQTMSEEAIKIASNLFNLDKNVKRLYKVILEIIKVKYKIY